VNELKPCAEDVEKSKKKIDAIKRSEREDD
jgi:hypothetical protein